MLWLTIIVFFVILLTLVLVHEFGHFLVAKITGCRIEEFAFGFPPRLFSKTIGDTKYSFNLLPLGGYVKIEGENMDETAPAPTSFASKSVPARLLILVAGVVMNFLLAVILLSVQAGIGVPTAASDENSHALKNPKTFIVGIEPGSPAASAGINELDRIYRIAGITNPSIQEVQTAISAHAGQEITIIIERMGLEKTFTLIPRANPPTGEGPLGISLQAVGLLADPWWKAPYTGLTRAWQMLLSIITQFQVLIRQIISQGTVSQALTGPVGIAFYAKEVTNLGLSYILEFAALISLNLALINILPIPALDGGRVMFVLIEGLVGKRMPNKIEQISHLAGFVLLITLMVLITLKDIKQFF